MRPDQKRRVRLANFLEIIVDKPFISYLLALLA